VIDLKICGLQKLSMVDYPGKLAATVFTGGCNLRCPFCHNALLVTRLTESPVLDENEVLQFLASRRGLLDGMVLSGGEPLLQAGAVDFLEKVRKLGFFIKVDTNGCYPWVLAEILRLGLADYVAMDIKNRPEKYAETVGIPGFSLDHIEKSIQLLRSSGVDHEFRTTVVREFHTADDIAAIAQWLGEAPAYYLQNFEDSGNLISHGLHGFSLDELQILSNSAKKHLKSVFIRGK
jgi:pyruvate formate lyase activating enzyme